MKDRWVKFQISRVGLILPGLVCILLLSSIRPDNSYQANDNLRIMFYNVENLFDTINSKLDDNEFLPGSERQWNVFRYKRKLTNIAKVIISAGTWNPPDIIGLCEVENERVVSDLLSQTMLKSIGYRHIYSPNKDSRGIGVALVYSPEFKLLSTEILYPVKESGDTLATRSVLFAILADDVDTLGLIVNHWPSRRGGVTASNDKRDLLSKLVADRFINNSTGLEGQLKMIIMGDMNCEPGSETMNSLVNPADSIAGTRFYNVAQSNNSRIAGSYKYQGRWLLYDQILINDKLKHSRRGYSYKEGSFNIIGNDFQFTDDRSFKGVKPFSTWNGPSYQGGYSDHLPVIIELIR